jgi:hypothetical protein
MKGGKILDVESVAHEVLGCWNVDDIGVVIDALENLVGAITSRLEFEFLSCGNRSLLK